LLRDEYLKFPLTPPSGANDDPVSFPNHGMKI
jgi:hypothetical protein